ncbi:MAG: hypothetical protein HY738_13140 [Bacteroidia bacterium]|nr:hypothetical protein [Bacteroidia bacterium]
MKKVIINLITCIVCVMSVKAQQINNSGFYHLDRYTYNPAGAGTKPYLFLSGSYCKYWPPEVTGIPLPRVVQRLPSDYQA